MGFTLLHLSTCRVGATVIADTVRMAEVMFRHIETIELPQLSV